MSIDTSKVNQAQLTDEELFCLEGCRSYKQYYSMRQGFESGACAFCTINPELNVVEWEDEFMRVWHVHPQFMRPELKLHILIAPKRHVRFLADLAFAEWHSLASANEFAKKHFGYTGGMFHAREGDMRKNAGTVPHLHINIFEPNGTEEVRVPVYKKLDDREANQTRAKNYAQLYENGMPPDKFKNLTAEGLYNSNGERTQPLGHTST